MYEVFYRGEIVYKNTVVSKIPGFPSDKFEAILGSRQECYIKDRQYKSLTNGSQMNVQIYDDQTNQLYLGSKGTDSVMVIDASKPSDSVLEFKMTKNAETVMGIPCDALFIKTTSGSTTFYYNPKYKINSSAYAKHRYGNWAFFAEKTHSLPLKTIIDNKQFKMENVAMEIKPSTLPVSFFKIDVKHFGN
ncbi:MAG: hypothetical protein JST68_21410 [Bacteroidetes bacterium]|nr:hypothetical protein [Bacteroidota bacterium]